jgi:hypothetical protein
LTCPICRKRKAARFCPAKSQTICSTCCATEREVTIDCPSDCPHLVASRRYEEERHEIDLSNVPFADVKVSLAAFHGHESLIDTLAYSICDFAGLHRETVDSDVLSALQALGESYQTLAKGIYYEKPLDYRLQHNLVGHLKQTIAAYKKEETNRLRMTGLRDETVRDALIFMAQAGGMRINGRPKGRAYIDFLRSQVKWQAPVQRDGAPLVIVP